MITIPAIPSTIVATCYTALVTALACVQFHRSRTPLRLGSAVMAVCGLSISALSIVYAADKMSLSIFWVYQFVAECIAVTWVISTIIQLGYAFYPLTRHQTLIWKSALASVIIYDLVAMSELTYYCYAVWGSQTLNRESTPVVWIYWLRQIVKVLACAVTIAYLFVPLVRHHKSTGVAMIADTNTLAVGTWYLSALGVTSIGYCAMFVYYMTKPGEVFSPQAQALDLCIRLIACPIFSLPPPRILLRHYQHKYGSGARDDNNLNTMIEDGITNNPRPRRPAMLVAQPSFPSARQGDFIFDPPHHRHSSYLASKPSVEFHHSTYAKREIEEKSRSIEGDLRVGGGGGGGAALSFDATATEVNKNNNISSGDGGAGGASATPLYVSSDSPTPARSTTTGMDEAVSNLSISTRSVDFQTTLSANNNNNLSPATTPTQHLSSPLTSSFISPNSTNNDNNSNNSNNSSSKMDEEDETAVAARRISRRLTMEGRRDGLDFLNIAGRIKWPHRSNNSSINGGQASGSTTTLPSTTSMVFISTTPLKSPLAIKSSQSFPPIALNRAGPGGSSSWTSISSRTEDQHRMVARGSGGTGGGDRKERLSVIGSVLDADGVLSHDEDDDSYHSQRQRDSFQELSEKPSSSSMGTVAQNSNSNHLSSSSNSTIRPPSPSVEPSNNTPTPSHISTELKAMKMDIDMDMDMDKIRKQSRDALTRLHGDSRAAAVANTATIPTGPHSPTILRTGPKRGSSEKLGRPSISSSTSSSSPLSPISSESLTTTPLSSSSSSP